MRMMAAMGLVVGLGAVAGCEPDDGDDLGSAEQRAAAATEVCAPFEDGAFPMMATLAITTAFELQRWESTTDFVYRDGRVVLSDAALARCQALGVPGCDNVSAVLAFQDAPEIVRDGVLLFDPVRYRRLLKRYSVRQKIADALPCRSPWASLCVEHELVFDHTSVGPCSVDYWFGIELGSECNRRGCGRPCKGFTADPAKLVNKLVFAGYPDNGYLDPDFILTGTLPVIGVDPPLFSMIEGAAIPTVNGCYNAVAIYDPTGSLAGSCCQVLDSVGTLTTATWNADTLVCSG